MIRLIITIALILGGHLCISAQQLPEQWVRRFQAQGKAQDRISAITTDISGNVFVAGLAGNHHGVADAFAMKRNPQGDTLWTYYYDGGGNNEDYANDIFVDNAGNTYITGWSRSTAFVYDCFTAKLLPSGTQAWVSRYSAGGTNQSYGNALTVDGTGNVYVAGYIDPSSASNDWLVIKYNASGVQQWVDILNGPGNGDDEAWDIVIAPNGNPTVCGFAYSVNASGNINSFVKQYTPANATVWTDTWTNPGFTGADKAFGLGYNSSGHLFIGGETKNSTGSNRDAFAIRYDAAGTRQWVHIYTDATTSVDEYLRHVIIDANGNVYFTGTDFQDGYVTCIRSDGTNGYRKRWRGPITNGSDVFHSIAVDDAGSLYATGRGVYSGPNYYGNGGLPNMIITKYGVNGDSLWTYRCKDSLNSSMAFAITHRNGRIYAGGFVTDTAYIDENLYTIIIDTAGIAVKEWIYNGKGDAITMGQFVVTDILDNVYCSATIDRLHGEGYDIAIIKYDPLGNLLWQKYYSSFGWNNDTLTAMQIDPFGNIILSISSDSAKLKNNYRLSLLKVDPQGNFLDTAWVSITGSTLARSMITRNDGSIALSASSSIHGGIIIFFNSMFKYAWSAKIDSTQFAVTRANSIGLFSNGDLVLGGYSQVSGSTIALVQRYNSGGVKLWSTVVDSISVFDEIRDVTVDSLDDVAFTGATGAIILLGKINGSNGNLIWRQVYNPTSTTSEYGVKVKFTPAGNVVLISRGWTGFVARYYTVQYTGSGVFQWVAVYSQTASDREPVDLIVDSTNRVITAGWAINSVSTNYDYVLAGYNPTGSVAFINTYTTTIPNATSWDQLNDLAKDTKGDFIVTGRTATEFYNNYLYKMLTIKYGGVMVGKTDPVVVNGNLITLYPNPSVSGKFYIRDLSPNTIQSGKIYDIMGRLVATFNPLSGMIDLQETRFVYFSSRAG
jgi:hypothetical protein